MNQQPDRTRPMSNVYQVHFLGHQLPETDREKLEFARQHVRRLTGLDQLVAPFQPSTKDDSCRLSIAVPQRLTQAVRNLEQSGLEIQFTEPEHPYVEDDRCYLPALFQIIHCRGALNPAAIQDNPARLEALAEIMAEQIPGLPPAAANWRNWTNLRWDPHNENSIFVISWNPQDQHPEEPEESETDTGPSQRPANRIDQEEL